MHIAKECDFLMLNGTQRSAYVFVAVFKIKIFLFRLIFKYSQNVHG
jgi:hypothetical protein